MAHLAHPRNPALTVHEQDSVVAKHKRTKYTHAVAHVLNCNMICDQIFQKGSYTHTVSRHTFHRHLVATLMDQQNMCLILLKVEQSTFTQVSFSSLSDIHECSGGIIFP